MVFCNEAAENGLCGMRRPLLGTVRGCPMVKFLIITLHSYPFYLLYALCFS